MARTNVFVRVGLFLLGSIGLITFFASILRDTWLNNRQRDWIAIRVANLVRWAFVWRARRCRSNAEVQNLMAWAFPVYNFGLVAVWFLLVQTSFALLIWTVEADRGMVGAFIASGSALSTLGFATPSSVAGRLFGIVEGAIGLGIIVFLFTFIPGYQAAIQAREEKVAWLYARTGAHPTAFSLVQWCRNAGQGSDLTPLWNTGESWFRQILETHSLTPLLALVPSIHEGQTWIEAAATLLDATSFAISTIDAPHVESARLCRNAGLDALRAIAPALPGAMDHALATNRSADDIAIAYDAAYDAFRTDGLSVEPNRDDCRHEFFGLRSEYEGLVRGIAAATLMPLEE